jgi:hypothetical protein
MKLTYSSQSEHYGTADIRSIYSQMSIVPAIVELIDRATSAHYIFLRQAPLECSHDFVITFLVLAALTREEVLLLQLFSKSKWYKLSKVQPELTKPSDSSKNGKGGRGGVIRLSLHIFSPPDIIIESLSE